MRRFRCGLGSALLGLVWVLGPANLQAGTAPDPLRLVPKQANLIIETPQPRQLVEAFTTLELLQQLQQFDAVRELYDSTRSRQFYQLVAYYEKQFKLKWPELLDRIAGGGVVVAVKLGPNPAPALLVVQGKDEKTLHRFAQLALEVLEQELARQEVKVQTVKKIYRNIETVQVGDKLHAAVAGSALLVSNEERALRLAIDLHLDGPGNSLASSRSVAETRRLLPPDPLAWLWLNLDVVHQAPQAKELFARPRNDTNLTVLFGGLLDVLGRSPFLGAGFYRQPDGFLLTVRMPRGRERMPPELAVHVPPAGQPASLPLLQPRGVLFSDSYWLDVSKFWDERTKLFNKRQAEGLEKFDKRSAFFLGGNRFSKLLAETGPYQRFVVAHQRDTGYKTVPAQRLPAFALVVSLRKPHEFDQAMQGILRGAALLAGARFQLKLVEEKHGKYTIVGYRFPEDVAVPGDVNNIRFNFSPCFVTVGDQFIACSTLELCRDLVDQLHKEAGAWTQPSSPAAQQSNLFAVGVAEALKAGQDQLVAQTILGQALSPDEARQQVEAFIDWVRGLGVLRSTISYGAHNFRFELHWKIPHGRTH